MVDLAFLITNIRVLRERESRLGAIASKMEPGTSGWFEALADLYEAVSAREEIEDMVTETRGDHLRLVEGMQDGRTYTINQT